MLGACLPFAGLLMTDGGGSTHQTTVGCSCRAEILTEERMPVGEHHAAARLAVLHDAHMCIVADGHGATFAHAGEIGWLAEGLRDDALGVVMMTKECIVTACHLGDA